MMRPLLRSRQRGFTLVEAIIVMVIIGVLGAIVAVFIRLPIQGYADTLARAELTDQADLAMRRIARDLRRALPNSIRVNPAGSIVDPAGSTIEFLLTTTGGRYLSAEDGVDNLPPLDFVNGNPNFAVVAVKPSFARAAVGDFVVVFNLGPGFPQADAYSLNDPNATGRNIAAIQAINMVNADTAVITLAQNPFVVGAGGRDPMPSPTHRFQVVSGAVSYRCGRLPDGRLGLTRHWGYGINPQQQVPPVGGRAAVLAAGVAGCANVFRADTLATRRSSLVMIALELLGRNTGQANIRLLHQVHVDNAP